MEIRVHSGTLPKNSQILQKQIDNQPFIHRLDVVLTASEEQAQSLASLETSYYRCRITFSELFLAFYASSSARIALALGSPLDTWCLDTRGILTLCLTSQTYERLGIGSGSRVGSGVGDVRFLVKLNLDDKTSTLAVRAKKCLEQWDIQRAAEGESGWDALLSFPPVPSGISATCPDAQLSVRALFQTTVDVHVPSNLIPSTNSDNAQDELTELFEWVGLASLGSQRLRVDDPVSSYAALYEPPSGSSVGKIFHLCWCGLISPEFVNSILQKVLESTGSVRAMSALSFSVPESPSSVKRAGGSVWTLIVSDTEVQGEKRWVLAENYQ